MKRTVLCLLAAILLAGCGAAPKERFQNETTSSLALPVETDSSILLQNTDSKGTPSPSPPKDESSETIFVYVCGAVEKPGVVELPRGSRIADAIAAAGGLLANADTRLVNQARLLADGEQITILTNAEAEALLGDDPKERAKRLLGKSADETKEEGVGSSTQGTGGKVSLNHADLTTLMTLPGIGEAKARAIIEYRETYGAFASIEDVQNVPGIKGSVYSKIKDLVSL